VRLRIVWNRERFEFVDSPGKRDTYDNKEEIKNAGGFWDKDNKVWWAPAQANIGRLRPLRPTISPEAMERFLREESCRRTSIEASRATDAVGNFPKPDGLEYLPYQRAGIAYTTRHKDTLIADEMGLGKTIQAIGTINADKLARRVLIVCPATLKLNWKKEFAKWDTKNLSYEVITPKTKSFPSIDVVIINYELMGRWQSELRAFDWDVLVVDEAHYVKNPSTKRAQEIFGRKKARTKEKRDDATGEVTVETRLPLEPLVAKRRLFLTGTPIVNKPIEMWPLIQVLDPDGLGANFMKYAKRYCGAYHNGYGWDFNGSSNLDELQEILRSKFMVRRLKKDVLKELPAKVRQVLVLEASPKVKELLEKEKKTYDEYTKFLKDGDFETPHFGEMSAVRKAVAAAKIPFIVDHVKTVLEEQDKVCVFVHHHEVVDALVDEFGKSCVSIDGRTTNEDRQAAVDRFQSDPSCTVFVGTIRAAGVGITLTASSTVIFGELDWVPGNVSQAEDRCHRIGQMGTVFVRHLVLEGSLDERMAQIIVEKQETIDRALDTAPQPDPRVPEMQIVDIREVPPPVMITPDKAGWVSLPTVEMTREEIKEIYPDAKLPRPEHERLTHTNCDDQFCNVCELFVCKWCGKAEIELSEPCVPHRAFTKAQEQAVLQGLRQLASMCDGAQDIDGCGFNKRDTRFGKILAEKTVLTQKMFLIGQKMLRLYHRQLSPELLQSAGVEVKKK
jgi:superfamily II DNA or RNA helicase